MENLARFNAISAIRQSRFTAHLLLSKTLWESLVFVILQCFKVNRANSCRSNPYILPY